jgi:hypothetical protein
VAIRGDARVFQVREAVPLKEKSMFISNLKSAMVVVSICFFSVILSSPIVGEPLSLTSDDPLIGTWQREEKVTYDTNKWVVAPNGKALEFFTGHDEPYEEAQYSIEKKWVDENEYTNYQCVYIVTACREILNVSVPAARGCAWPAPCALGVAVP